MSTYSFFHLKCLIPFAVQILDDPSETGARAADKVFGKLRLGFIHARLLPRVGVVDQPLVVPAFRGLFTERHTQKATASRAAPG